ncbi:MAG: non-ribosomal peptide synthetase [Clostridia bacterium]|nr:non-ribosomal peptide synthetase [Clostridia bacterium]
MSKITKQLRQSLSSLGGEPLLERVYGAAVARGDGAHAELAASIRRLSLSGEQLAQRVGRTAAAIRGRFGVTDRYIGIAAASELDWLVLLWAVLKSGNKPFLMESVRSGAENDAALTTLEAAGVVSCGGTIRTTLPLLAWDALPTEGEMTGDLPPFGKELALFGADGGVCVLDGERWIARLSQAWDIPDPAKKDPYKWLIALPLTTDAGFALYLLSTLSGAVAVFSAELSAEGVMRTARSLRVTHLAATPGVWHKADRQLCRLLDSKDEKTRNKFYRSLEGKGPAPSFRELSSHLFGDSLRGCICLEGAIRDAARGRLSVVGYAVWNGSDGASAETAVERVFDLPQAEEWVALAGADGEGICLVIQIPEDLLSLQKQNLQRAVDVCRARLPESTPLAAVWYTTDPLAEAPNRGVDRAVLKARIASGKLRMIQLSQAEGEAGEESEIKKILRSMFADILEVGEHEIPDDGHFMIDLGGSSLDYFTLVGEINERFGINLGFEGEEFRYTLNDFERAVKDLVK